ncbi:uncharacterized protein LOC143219995 [Lasioglossum baleicum]|uniref:uncharacterized protein LOC143219995 n=1 Tax=Lasioglossum baleicum TaxID=434251 RepID=UPI003FCE67CF
MSYLGLTLDSRWCFEQQFDRMAPRVEGVVAAVGRLLPNIGGPDDRIRRLYSGLVHAKFLYGAPVWSEQLLASRRNMLHANRVQRRQAIRTIQGYRTISGEAACLLAGMTPLHLMAVERATTYQIACSIRRGELCPEGEEMEVPRRQARQDILALLPVLEEWCRSRVRLTYHVTQVLSGHGCFGEYLCRIGKEPTPQAGAERRAKEKEKKEKKENTCAEASALLRCDLCNNVLIHDESMVT